MIALGHGDVKRTVGRVNPAVADQHQRTVRGGVLGKLEFDPMVPGNSLIFSKRKISGVFAVSRGEGFRNVTAVLVLLPREWLRRRCAENLQFGLFCRNKPFVNKCVNGCRMIDGPQRDVIEEVCLPKFGGDPDFVRSVFGAQNSAWNEDPVLRLIDAGGVLGVDPHPQR